MPPAEKVKARFELRAKNYDFLGKAYNLIDHSDIYFTARGSYAYSKKTSFFGRLGFGTVAFSEKSRNDYTYFTFAAGAEGNLSAKLKYTGEIGFYSQQVDVVNKAYTDSYSGPIWRGSVQYGFSSEKTFLEGSLLRWIEYHSAENYQVVDAIETRVQHKPTVRTLLSGTLRLEFANPGNDRFSYFSWRLVAGVGFYYKVREYLYLGAGYEYLRRLSHAPLASYWRNRLFLHATVVF